MTDFAHTQRCRFDSTKDDRSHSEKRERFSHAELAGLVARGSEPTITSHYPARRLPHRRSGGGRTPGALRAKSATQIVKEEHLLQACQFQVGPETTASFHVDVMTSTALAATTRALSARAVRLPKLFLANRHLREERSLARSQPV